MGASKQTGRTQTKKYYFMRVVQFVVQFQSKPVLATSLWLDKLMMSQGEREKKQEKNR